MAEFVKASAPPMCLCGLRHWSSERERCKFYEAPVSPHPQPHGRFGTATKAAPAIAQKKRGETENRRGGGE